MKKSVLALSLLAAVSSSVWAEDMDHWVLRVGVANVSPDDSSGPVLGNDGVGVKSATALGLSLAYMVDTNWGIELLASSPFDHDIKGTGALEGLDIGSAKQLPPTLSVLYQWGETTKFHAGAGVNYTLFFSDKASNSLVSALGASTADLKLDNSLGLSLKLGFDMPITDKWSLNGNVYYMDIDTTADVIVDGVRAASVDVNIDPWVFMLGVSTTF